ncbi:MAG TPA: NADH:flavin oxidoreductase [Nitrospirae bacterium]|nr:NADH:flavin oxidoreductase [Nitrospirota bacterium]
MRLFEPLKIGTLEVKNRIIRSATYEKMADEDGFVTDQLIDFYKQLALGGAGLIITGNALVDISGYSAPKQICIHNDFYIDGLKRLVDKVRSFGAKIAIQLVHGGRQCFPFLLAGKEAIAPSSVYDPSINVTPRAMTDDEIWQIIYAFSNSARRAMIAGFDAIQLHGAHGYLISSFLSPHTNQRDDYWGGDEERRFHFVEELYKATRSEVGDGFPIFIKLNGDDFLPKGLKIDESLRIGKRLQYLGINAIEVSGGMYESKGSVIRAKIDSEGKEAYFKEYSIRFKSELSIPIILVGGIKSKNVAEKMITDGYADAVSMSRALIREPNLPNKFMEGKEKADCISCNGCTRFLKLDYVRCVEKELASNDFSNISPSSNP